LKGKRLDITNKDAMITELYPEIQSMHDQIEKKKTENILHFLEASYKTIAHFQSANGQWND
jgi:glycogen debranching enzyme